MNRNWVHCIVSRIASWCPFHFTEPVTLKRAILSEVNFQFDKKFMLLIGDYVVTVWVFVHL